MWDCEELHEEGGVISLIEEMQPLLKKINVKLNYSNDTYDDYAHTITVNGTSYLMAHAEPGDWSETFENFAEMLNAELQIQNSKERLYLMTNEGSYIVLLTDEQYNIITDNIPLDKRPLTPDDFATKSTDKSDSEMSKLEMYMPHLIDSMSAVKIPGTTTPPENQGLFSRIRYFLFRWLK